MKRYTESSQGWFLDPEGDWVDYKDAADLQRQLAAADAVAEALEVRKADLERQLAETKAELDRIKEILK